MEFAETLFKRLGLIEQTCESDLCSSPSLAFGWFYRYEGKLPSLRKVQSAA